MQSFHTCYI